jgi:hypothetical protein
MLLFRAKHYIWIRAENPKPKGSSNGARDGGTMKSSATLFAIALALGAITFAPWASIQAEGYSREEGPIEIRKCQTISQPGSYKLVNNLTFSASSGTCLTITASLVTIDLAGFSISGDGGQSIAISGSGQGIVVRNGSIANFRTQVDLGSADSSVVEGLRIFGFNDGVGILANGIVKGNIVTGHINGKGISGSGTITGNYVVENSIGIDVNQGSTVIGNTSVENDIFGIQVNCPSNVTDNTAISNAVNLVLNGNGCNNTNNVAP